MTTPVILQIIPRLDTGGAERTTVDMVQAILESGGVPLVATAGGRMIAEITELGGEVIEFPADTKNPVRMMRNIDRLVQIISERQVDLVHARSRAPAWSSYYAAKRAGRPFVTTYHGAYKDTGYMKNRYNSIMAKGDIVIANSEFTAKMIQERHNIDEEIIRVIYRGVDVRAFSRSVMTEERISEIRQSWGVLGSDRVVLHAARLTNWKGQKVVIDAAAILAERGVLGSMQFILAGDSQGRDDYEKGLHTRIAERGLEDNVKIVGHVEDMPAAYAACSVAIVASIEPEAFGRVAAEAQAVGRPVIVTDHGAAPETVIPVEEGKLEGATGWLIPPANPVALADALTEYFTFPETQRHVMGLRARDHVASNFSLELMCVRTLDVYDELLGSRLAPVYSRRQGVDLLAVNA